jgi:cell division inhibitor SepF
MPGLLRRTMVYLGLVDDAYDDYEPYDEPQVPEQPTTSPPPSRGYSTPPEQAYESGGHSAIRTIPREREPVQTEAVSSSPIATRSAVVRPIQPMQTARVHVMAPSRFPDAQEIGDRLKASQPVIVNLQGADRDLSRRMIDFCSGATYALGGSMEKVADHVFLLTPSNVEVSAEERRRLQERGLYDS